MTLPLTNTNSAATLAAAEGQAALGVGDTPLARRKFAEAGGALEREMKIRHGGGEKQLLRFLAATQYYKGGDYKKAQELAEKIDARVLPKNVRALFPQFLKDAHARASPEYARGVRRALYSLWLAQQTPAAIALLQEHPYVVDAPSLAFMRATLCDRLPDYRAAALFFAAASRYASEVESPEIALISAATPLMLLSQGRVAEARECVEHRLELLPTAVTCVTAILVGYHQLIRVPPEERQKCSEGLLPFVERAWLAYRNLPGEQQNYADMRADMRAYLAFGFEIAAGCWHLLGNTGRGKEAWDRAVQLGTNPATAWAVRAFGGGRETPDGQEIETDYVSERETHFSERFAPERSVREQLEVVGA
jgi:tetratricopeptide (TPR) repeat protein